MQTAESTKRQCERINLLLQESNDTNVKHLMAELFSAQRTFERGSTTTNASIYATISYNVSLAMLKTGNIEMAASLLQETIKRIYDIRPLTHVFSTANPSWYISAYKRILQHEMVVANNTLKIYQHMGGLLAFCWMLQNNWKLAQALFSAILTDFADDLKGKEAFVSKIYVLDAVCKLSLNESAEGIKSLNMAKLLNRNLPQISYWKSFLDFNQANYRELLIDAKESIGKYSYECIDCLNLAAFAYLHFGDTNKALDDCRRAIEIDCLQGISLFNISMIYELIQRNDAKLQMLTYLKQLRFTAVSNHSNIHSLKHLKLPMSQMRNFTRWRIVESDALKDLDYLMSYELARAAIEKEDWDIALKFLNAYCAVDNVSSFVKNEIHLWKQFAFLLLQKNMPKKALKAIDAMLSIHKTDMNFLLMKADALLCLERFEESKQTLQKVISYIVLNREEEKCIESDSLKIFEVQVYNNLALIYSCTNEIKKALEYVNRSLEISPNLEQLLFNKCLLLWRANQKTLACTTWFNIRGICLNESREYYEQLINSIELKKKELTLESLRSQYSSHVSIARNNQSVSNLQRCFIDHLLIRHWLQVYKDRLIQWVIATTQQILEKSC